MRGSTLFPITEPLCPRRLEPAQMRMEKEKGDGVKQSSHFKEPNLFFFSRHSPDQCGEEFLRLGWNLWPRPFALRDGPALPPLLLL